MMKEEVPKRLRPFLDPTVKLKQRFQALWDFYYIQKDVTEQDKIQFMLEHLDMILDFTVESLTLIQSRLMKEADYEEKLVKHLREQFYPGLMLHLILDHLDGKTLAEAPQLSKLVNVLRVMLHPQNVMDLRTWGMELTLLWIHRHQAHCPTIVSHTLYASMISLKVAEKFPLLTSTEEALLKTKEVVNESIVFAKLLQISTFPSALTLVKVHYLDKIYNDAEVNEDLQVQIIRNFPVQSKEIVQFWHHNRILTNVILKQAFLLPYHEYSTIKIAMQLSKTLLISTPSENINEEVDNEGREDIAALMTSLFNQRPHIGYATEQADSFQQAIYYFVHICNGKTALLGLECLLAAAKVMFHRDDLIVQSTISYDLQRLWAFSFWSALLSKSSGVELDDRSLWEQIGRVHESFSINCLKGPLEEWAYLMHHLTNLLTNAKSDGKASKWSNIITTQNSIAFSWRNVLRSIGPVTRFIQCQAYHSHELVTLTIARIADQLVDSSNSSNQKNARLIRDLIPTLLMASQNFISQLEEKEELQRARYAALAVLCKLFQQQPQPRQDGHIDQQEAYLAGFYHSLKLALQQVAMGESLMQEDNLMTILLEGASDLFSRGLPGSSSLLNDWLGTINFCIEHNPSLLQLKLWDVCRLLGDAFVLCLEEENDKDKAIYECMILLYDRVVKEHVASHGPMACLLATLILQVPLNERNGKIIESFWTWMLEMTIPRSLELNSLHKGVNPLVLQCLHSLITSSDMVVSRRENVIQRLILAVRSCLLPVQGGDNTTLDDSGAQLLECLGYWLLDYISHPDDSEKSKEIKEEVPVLLWRLLYKVIQDCRHGHHVPGRPLPKMTQSAKWLEHVILAWAPQEDIDIENYHNNDINKRQGERMVIFNKDHKPSAILKATTWGPEKSPSLDLICQVAHGEYTWTCQPIVDNVQGNEVGMLELKFYDTTIMPDVSPFNAGLGEEIQALSSEDLGYHHHLDEDKLLQVNQFMQENFPEMYHQYPIEMDVVNNSLQDMLQQLHHHEQMIAIKYRQLICQESPRFIDLNAQDLRKEKKKFDLFANVGFKSVSAWRQHYANKLTSDPHQNESMKVKKQQIIKVGYIPANNEEMWGLTAFCDPNTYEWASPIDQNVAIKYFPICNESLETDIILSVGDHKLLNTGNKPIIQVKLVPEAGGFQIDFLVNDHSSSETEMAGPLGYGCLCTNPHALGALINEAIKNLYSQPLVERYQEQVMNNLVAVVRNHSIPPAQSDLAHFLLGSPDNPWQKVQSADISLKMLYPLKAAASVFPSSSQASSNPPSPHLIDSLMLKMGPASPMGKELGERPRTHPCAPDSTDDQPSLDASPPMQTDSVQESLLMVPTQLEE